MLLLPIYLYLLTVILIVQCTALIMKTPFPLNDFTQHLDQTTQERGLRYFLDGKVKEVDTAAGSMKSARVMGTKDYTVEFELEKGILKSHQCDCPFTEKPFCKHEAAFIFHLQQDRLDVRPLRRKSTSA